MNDEIMFGTRIPGIKSFIRNKYEILFNSKCFFLINTKDFGRPGRFAYKIWDRVEHYCTQEIFDQVIEEATAIVDSGDFEKRYLAWRMK